VISISVSKADKTDCCVTKITIIVKYGSFGCGKCVEYVMLPTVVYVIVYLEFGITLC